ncbi:MAG: LacI family DNA-binding transcriptional regulator [Victivallaceae bacterium]|nr:LacI family DNA-binding transcriptional regulator [Victivallaceae bacterium]
MNQSDIAREVGVSQTAVSMVLNNPDTTKVSKEKRQLIGAFLKKSNYFNRADVRKTWNIGYVMDEYQNSKSTFYHRLISGIEEVIEQNGYNLFVETFRGAIPSVVKRRKVDGIIHSADIKNDDCPVPMVLLNRAERKMSCDTVMPDNAGAIYQAMEHLVELGHRRIAFLALLPVDQRVRRELHMINFEERFDAFNRATEYFDTKIVDGYIQIPKLKNNSDSMAKITEVLQQWNRMKKPPTAVVCSNDGYAAILLRIALDSGMKVPEELSIIGIDNKEHDIIDGAMLTTVDQNFLKMGQIAAELLLKRINRADTPVVRVNCESSLIKRMTTGINKSKEVK